MRRSSGSKAALITLIALVIVLVSNHLPNAVASGSLQPSTFYFHNQATKTLNTISTYLWANTSQTWSSGAQFESRNVVSGTPGVWNYYSQPAMAGNVTFTGPVIFVLYLISSSGTGGGTVITGNVNKITTAGTVVALAVGSLSGTSISTTLTAYTISLTSSSYQIEQGAILNFQITITITGTTTRTISLLYDGAAWPSQVAATFQQRIGINFYSSFNQTGLQTSFFSRNWTGPGRQVTLRASVFDALGLYDIASARSNLTSPSGSTVLSNSPLTRVQGNGQNYTGTWAINWTYTTNTPSGSYSSKLAVTDNSGISLIPTLTFKVIASWLLNLHAVSLDPTPLSKRHYRKPQPRGHLPTSCRNILNIYRYVERSQRSRVVDPLQPEEWTRTRQASDIRPHGYGRGPERPTGLRSSSHPNPRRPNIHSEHDRKQRSPSLPLAPQGSVHRDCQKPITDD